jgi:hypothetical protein
VARELVLDFSRLTPFGSYKSLMRPHQGFVIGSTVVSPLGAKTAFGLLESWKNRFMPDHDEKRVYKLSMRPHQGFVSCK